MWGGRSDVSEKVLFKVAMSKSCYRLSVVVELQVLGAAVCSDLKPVYESVKFCSKGIMATTVRKMGTT